MKQFMVGSTSSGVRSGKSFRHNRSKHGIVMNATVNINQIDIEKESSLFPIYYDDSYDVVV